MTPVAKTWRVLGALLALTLYVVAVIDGGFWVLAGLGFGAVIVFLGSWSIAAWFDVHQEDER